ncbi:hypothetical protein DPMN_148253 [Dreissena polymorpha]|uniref:Uncharacterized protein n=1 Tax=Dreissena polymorpha TaxID=45954 RepID=A0A9D4FDM5_DREPO|nr:hypothetical protein DPMN_148253 [Dreissena polymorpha]
MDLDMRQLSMNLQTILDELHKFKSTQEASIQFVEVSYSEKLQEIRDLRTKLNASLDALENATLNELDTIRTKLQTSLNKDVDNCNKLKDELKHLHKAVNALCDKRKTKFMVIASKKSENKILECETFLKENIVKSQSSIIFKANIDIEQYLCQQFSLGRIIDSMRSLALEINSNKVLTLKTKSENIVRSDTRQYRMRISSDTSFCRISGISSLPSGHVVVADQYNGKLKLLDKHYNVSSHCNLSAAPIDICQITSSEVAVIVKICESYETSAIDPGNYGVQFISVSNGQLVNGRKFQLPHGAVGIAHHQGALYVTSGTALYHYTLDGSLMKSLYDSETGIGILIHIKNDLYY